MDASASASASASTMAAPAALTSQERDQRILRAYTIHGNTFGIKDSETIPSICTGEHFCLAKETGPKRWHCVPTSHQNFYDYIQNKYFPGLDEWAAAASAATGLPPKIQWTHSRIFDAVLMTVPLETLVAELAARTDLAKPPPADSWDVLLSKFTRGRPFYTFNRRHQFFYRDPETGAFISLDLTERGQSANDRVRYRMIGDGRHEFETLSAIHPLLTVQDVYYKTYSIKRNNYIWISLEQSLSDTKPV